MRTRERDWKGWCIAIPFCFARVPGEAKFTKKRKHGNLLVIYQEVSPNTHRKINSHPMLYRVCLSRWIYGKHSINPAYPFL